MQAAGAEAMLSAVRRAAAAAQGALGRTADAAGATRALAEGTLAAQDEALAGFQARFSHSMAQEQVGFCRQPSAQHAVLWEHANLQVGLPHLHPCSYSYRTPGYLGVQITCAVSKPVSPVQMHAAVPQAFMRRCPVWLAIWASMACGPHLQHGYGSSCAGGF
jgi:hypothetical protein